MSKLNSLPDRAMELVATVGESLKQVPGSAGKLLEAGVVLGAVKTGARVAGGFVRRNPAIAVAAVAGAGLLWLAARHRAKRNRDEPIEGSAKRIEARRGEAGTRRRSRSTRKAGDESAATE
ncbi:MULTISPECIES: hypothetical protein [unclassified Lysobacter]|uniref:hypothetical protein n=1 Tax=unclassified Lysobacter TaxID=2635362 RepID=UPI0007022A6E|nr:MULTISPECIES: hypothetical protein [unclassified Lysobacter]KQZ59351.1 hypothetical protein ASD53_07245 [Lysobacter sp. Root559]KRA79815.1 hypothetical protein ASD78_18785 [Lysobacter sp. Root667]KRC34577.1 hypothetical protein ASE10_07660 [Lysobacter sp. Root76]KRD65883.1 hypothetical protein ASE45_18005 [Lysobacter sp. Root96]